MHKHTLGHSACCTFLWRHNIFSHWATFLCMYFFFLFFQCLKWFKLWYCRFCARGRPKGLPYIIHYALAHQAAQAVLLWSNSKRALIISLPLGGQLLEQRRQKLKSTPACSDCSEGERGGGRQRERGVEERWGPPFWPGRTQIPTAE